jgi:hypothetical protein
MLGDHHWTDAFGTVHVVRPHTDPTLTMCNTLVVVESGHPRLGCDTCVLATAVALEMEYLETVRTWLMKRREPSPART